MGMHLYRCPYEKRYFDFVRNPSNMTRIDLDWKPVLDAETSADAFVLANQEYNDIRHKNFYKESASFLYFLRCFFQHPIVRKKNLSIVTHIHRLELYNM